MIRLKPFFASVILSIGLLVPILLNAQVRPDVNSFSSSERTILVNAMMEYIDTTQVQKHCIHQSISGGHIHSDFDFLPFYRTL